ncbi:MAG: SH3 domain-containing protein, partial [Bellilinea sp.]
ASITTWNDYHWTNFLVIAIGVGLSVYMLARSPQLKPLVPNIAIAYGLLPPVVAAGFNLTAVSGSDWISPLTISSVHLAWAILAGIVAFILVGQSPTTLSGYLATALMAGLLAAAFLSTDKAKTLMVLSPTQPAVVINSTPTPTTAAAIPTPDLSAPSPSPTVTRTPTASFTPMNTAWPSTTPQPTPIWARVSAPTGGGAFLRDKPDGKILTSILNGNMLEVISEPVYGNHGVIWVQIRTEDGFEGWIVQSLLATATPSAGW